MWRSFVCGAVAASLPFASLAAPAWAQEEEEGRIIQVAPDDAGESGVDENEEAVQAMPAYWIGVLGGPVTDELRAHLELPADQGILVREVVPESPAAKAGIQQYDILLRAGDEELTGMRDLVDHVAQAGEAEGAVKLDLIRRGRQETSEVTPEKRPERMAATVPGIREFRIPEGAEGQMPFGFRNFGPDMLRGFAQPEMPDGVSVTMKKEGNQPAEITVKRGEESWTVTGDDPESLEQLPEDLRPFVANLDRGPAMFRQRLAMPPGAPQPFGGELQERLEAMERQMRELEEQFRDGNPRANEEN
ncbi:MAG: PDZ domain-containing protein [Pirellulales bacterium]